MLTVTLGELSVNAISAALDDRVATMGQQLKTLQRTRSNLKEQRDSRENARLLADNEFAIDATRAAIRDAIRANVELARAMSEPELDFPPDMTISQLPVDWTELELRTAWGDR